MPPRRAAEGAGPVDGDPADVQGGEGLQHARGPRRGPCAGPGRRRVASAAAAPSRVCSARPVSTPSGPTSTNADTPAARRRGDGVGEADRPADVVDPVARVGELSGFGQGPGQAADQRDRRLPVGDGVRDPAELGEHGVHQRGVEGVGDPQPPGPHPAGGQGLLDLADGGLGAGDHDGGRGVDRGDPGLVLAAGEQRQDVGLGRGDGEHRPAGRAGPASGGRGRRPAGRRRPGRRRRRRGRRRAPRPSARPARPGSTPNEASSRNRATSKANSAGWVIPVWSSSSAWGLPGSASTASRTGWSSSGSSAAHTSSKASANTGKRRGELPAHPEALAALPGEQQRRPSRRRPGRRPRSAAGSPAASAARPASSSSRPAPRTTARSSRTVRPVASAAPTAASGTSGLSRAQSRRRAAWAASACAPRADTGQADGTGGASARLGRRGLGRRGGGAAGSGSPCSRITWALVPLMPNEDTPARRGRPGSGHARASASSSTAPAVQSTCGVGVVGVQGGRQHAVPHRHDHLDDAGGAGGGLRVADVRLDRAQPQRPVRRAGPGRRWRAGPGPRSGRPGRCRCRAPRPRPPRPAPGRRWPGPGG